MKQGLYDPRNEHDACGVGFIAHLKGKKTHDIIAQGLQILINLDHRGAVGADPMVGDGAGCLIQIPDALLRDWAATQNLVLPAPGDYAVGMCFLPRDDRARAMVKAQFEHFIRVEGQTLIGWRDVPVDTSVLGAAVLARGRVIARGFHEVWGGPHAEVNALRAAARQTRSEERRVGEECSAASRPRRPP